MGEFLVSNGVAIREARVVPILNIVPFQEFAILVPERAARQVGAAHQIIGKIRAKLMRAKLMKLMDQLRGGVAAQRISGSARPDPLARFVDTAAVGQRLDEGDLAGGGPAVVARAEGSRTEGLLGIVMLACLGTGGACRSDAGFGVKSSELSAMNLYGS